MRADRRVFACCQAFLEYEPLHAARELRERSLALSRLQIRRQDSAELIVYVLSRCMEDSSVLAAANVTNRLTLPLQLVLTDGEILDSTLAECAIGSLRRAREEGREHSCHG